MPEAAAADSLAPFFEGNSIVTRYLNLCETNEEEPRDGVKYDIEYQIIDIGIHVIYKLISHFSIEYEFVIKELILFHTHT
mgnify:CR=1 FL=1